MVISLSLNGSGLVPNHYVTPYLETVLTSFRFWGVNVRLGVFPLVTLYI